MRSEKSLDTKCSKRAKKLYKLTKLTKYVALAWLIFAPFVTKW